MELTWVDVFATGHRTGNPLAVITGDALPAHGDMQGIAAELGLSETVFAVPGTGAGAPPRLRIFTPEAEIPLAGHPLVGAAWVLRALGWTGDAAVLRTEAGDIPVGADDTAARMTRIGPVHRGTVDARAVAAALATEPAGPSATAPVWDAGLPQVMLPVHDLDQLVPDAHALRDLGAAAGWAGVSAYRVAGEADGALQAEVRHFAPPIGITEDPVTGSAAGALGAALAAMGARTRPDGLDLAIRQGHHMGRPGRVDVSVSMAGDVPQAVTVGGAVVPFMTGTIGGTPAAG